MKDLLDEIEISYHHFCSDIPVFANTELHASGSVEDISTLVAWYDNFNIFRQKSLAGLESPTLRWLLGTAKRSSGDRPRNSRDYFEVWCEVVEEIIIDRLKLGCNPNTCHRGHVSGKVGCAVGSGRREKIIVTEVEGTNFRNQPDNGNSGTWGGSKKRKRVTPEGQQRREERRKKTVMVKRMFDLVEEWDEQEDEISRLKAENRKLREELELRVGVKK